jgi:predicted DNA-binding transcriptional regulator
MNNHSLLPQLLDFGLTHNEATIYLRSLIIGPSTIIQISQSTEIKRTTVHTAVERMIEKGIFEIEHHGWKKLYTATDPENLEILAKRQFHNKLELIPELKKISRSRSQNIYLKSHKGIENIKNLYSRLLQSLEPNTDYHIIGNVEMWTDKLGDYANDFFAERGKICRQLNISVRALFVDNGFARHHVHNELRHNVQCRFLPKNTVITTSYVTTSRMALFHQLIDYNNFFETNDPNFIHTQTELFNILWEYSSSIF